MVHIAAFCPERLELRYVEVVGLFYGDCIGFDAIGDVPDDGDEAFEGLNLHGGHLGGEGEGGLAEEFTELFEDIVMEGVAVVVDIGFNDEGGLTTEAKDAFDGDFLEVEAAAAGCDLEEDVGEECF